MSGLSFFQTTFLVPDYDEGIDFFVGKLGFTLKEDTKLSETKRWVVVTPGRRRNYLVVNCN